MIKKPIILLLIVIMLCSCQISPDNYGQSDNSQSKDISSTTADAINDTALLTPSNKNCQGASSENGYYSILALKDGSCNIMYLDYPSSQQIILCDNLNCTHNSEICTAWIAPNQGGVVPLVINQKLYLLSRGKDLADNYTCLPMLTQLSLDGKSANTLATFKASEEFEPPFAANNKYLYCVYKDFWIENSNATYCEKIIQIDLSNGKMSELSDVTNQGANIVGAYEDKLVLKFVEKDTNTNAIQFVIKVFSLKDKTFEEIVRWDGGDRKSFVLGSKCVFITNNDYSLYILDLKTHEMEKANNIIVPVDQPLGLESIEFVNSYENTVIFDVFNPGDEPKNAVTKRFGINLLNKALTELSLKTNFDGVKENVNIISELQDKLLVVSNIEQKEKLLLDENGIAFPSLQIVNQFALINKDDYWNSIENYKRFDNVWF